jgi:NAD(P)-dependent dehydrogenase (short-subunit alcohol dehydrogenase family)
VRRTAEAFGGIDIVVANAGVGAYGPFLELSREHLDEMLDVNLRGTLYAIRAALPHMLGREGDVTKRSTALPSPGNSASPAHSTTKCVSTASVA